MSTSQSNLCLFFLGLQPYTNYTFMLSACTSAGCASSQPLSGQTLQAAPHGKEKRTAKRWSYGLVFYDGFTRCKTLLSSIKLSRINLHKRIHLPWNICILTHAILTAWHCIPTFFLRQFPQVHL